MIHNPGGPALVLSPHLDDAVLSAWTTVGSDRDVVVLTVFAGVPPAGHLGRFDPIFGVTDSASLMRARRAEDAAALALAERTPIHLDFLDSQYREAPVDLEAVATEIRERLRAVSAIYAPAGIGDHPDHRDVRAVAVALAAATGAPLRVYAELPYAVDWGWPSWVTGEAPRPHLVPDAFWGPSLESLGGVEALDPTVHRLDERQSAAKLEAIHRYATQFAMLDGSPPGRLSHPQHLAFELDWTVRTPTHGRTVRERDEPNDRPHPPEEPW